MENSGNGKYRVLVADDSKTYQKIIEETFGLLGDNYKLIFANDGNQAINLANEHMPDLILMDVLMPEINGIQAIKLLKQNLRTSDIPVFVLSTTEGLQSAFEAGADDFILKPFKHYELLLKVKAASSLMQKINRIRKQNKELEERHIEVIRQRDLIFQQQKEIIDDIRYSKRIQDAILPHNSYIEKLFPDYFVLNIPKNIVSGDFYWVGEKNNKKIVSVADCTGHGISGAFMTMAGIAFLNEIINKYDFENANEVLFLLRDKVMTLLKQKGLEGEAADGMDISLCIFEADNTFMQYAGANNPIYVINNDKIDIYNADRMPIGIHVNYNCPFTNIGIKLNKGDMIYLFSDGYPDQFGGPKGKKFRYGQFQKLLMKISREPMNIQKDILYKTIIDWKGKEEQVDDILIMGIRVNFD
jgi:sigma-B regulation protein RsbU (phosphoserine phosphatase)